jgi:DNA-binding CsgD family transcriptional regulator
MSLDKISDELGEAIDRAALEPAAWQSVVSLLHGMFPGTKVALYVDDTRGAGNVDVISHGFEEKSLSEYAAHYSRINPWQPFWLRSACLRAVAADDVAPSSLFKETEFYRDWLVPTQEAESAAGVKLAHDKEWIAMLAAHYGRRAAKRYNVDLPSVLKNNARRLRRALELNRIARNTALRQDTSDFLSSFSTPTFALSGHARIVGLNAAAEEELARSNAFRLDGQRTLVHADQRISEQVTVTAAQIAANRGPLCDGHDIEIYRPTRLSISLFPFSPRLSSHLLLPRNLTRRLTLLLFRRTLTSSAADLWVRFHLTEAERRLATCISSGTSLRDSAAQLGISYETARNQLKAVFAKTGTHRQAELVAMRAAMLTNRIPIPDDGNDIPLS